MRAVGVSTNELDYIEHLDRGGGLDAVQLDLLRVKQEAVRRDGGLLPPQARYPDHRLSAGDVRTGELRRVRRHENNFRPSHSANAFPAALPSLARTISGKPFGPSGVAYTLQPSAYPARFGTGNRSLPSTLIVGLPQNVTGGRSVLGTGISLKTRAAPGAPRARRGPGRRRR